MSHDDGPHENPPTAESFGCPPRAKLLKQIYEAMALTRAVEDRMVSIPVDKNHFHRSSHGKGIIMMATSGVEEIGESRLVETRGAKLRGRVAFVTGGTRGIGAAISKSLASQGVGAATEP